MQLFSRNQLKDFQIENWKFRFEYNNSSSKIAEIQSKFLFVQNVPIFAWRNIFRFIQPIERFIFLFQVVRMRQTLMTSYYQSWMWRNEVVNYILITYNFKLGFHTAKILNCQLRKLRWEYEWKFSYIVNEWIKNHTFLAKC